MINFPFKRKLKKTIENQYYWESLLLEKYKTICFFIPKTASSSFRVAFYKLVKGKEPAKFEDVYDLPRLKKRHLSKYKDYFKFTIMRNPYDRLVSCYYDFIIDKRRARIFLEYAFYPNMSFKEFVEVACLLPDNKTDVHLKSQHTFITDKKGNLVIDLVARFEDLNIVYKRIMSVLGIENYPQLPHIKKSAKKKEFYTKELKEMVSQRYKKDFEIWGKIK